jgi:hypothetical protein
LNKLSQKISGDSLVFEIKPPEKREESCSKSHPLGFRNNPDYFNIFHFRVSLFSDKPDLHDKFWSELLSDECLLF